MTENVTTIALSKHAAEIANQMKDSGVFPDALNAAKFGMSYAIKYFWDDIGTSDKLIAFDKVYDSKGNNYNVGSIDSDKYIENLMLSLYPNCESPYKFARILMCYGLNQLGDYLDNGTLFPINKFM